MAGRTGKFKLWVLLVIGMALLSGCKQTDTGVRKPAAQKPKAVVVEKVTPAQEEQKVEKEVYDYNAAGRRDPFLSLISVAKERPHKKRGATAIENFDIDEIKLTAIVWDSHQYYALVTLPDNKSYTIKKGMTLGLYGGKVEEITKDSVLIREHIKDYRGQMITKDTTLKLRKEGEE